MVKKQVSQLQPRNWEVFCPKQDIFTRYATTLNPQAGLGLQRFRGGCQSVVKAQILAVQDLLCGNSSEKAPGNRGKRLGVQGKSIRVARLQSKFCTKKFSSYEFSYEKCWKFLSLYSVGQKKFPQNSPQNFPPNFQNFPAKNKKKFTDELLQDRREKKVAKIQVLLFSFFAYSCLWELCCLQVELVYSHNWGLFYSQLKAFYLQHLKGL